MASDAPKPAEKPIAPKPTVVAAKPAVPVAKPAVAAVILPKPTVTPKVTAPIAPKITAPVAPKPTIKVAKVTAVTAPKVGGGETLAVPAGAGSVAAPADTKDSVRQPAVSVSPEQKPKTPVEKTPSPKAPAEKAPATRTPHPAATFELPAAVYSPQLVESVIYDIEHYLEWYRQTQIQKKVGAKATEEPTHSAETVLVIESWLSGKPATLETLEDLLATLRGLKLSQVHIMLAALPNRAQRELLVNWFRTNVSPHLLLSFVADRNLGGGAVIRTPNRVFDYTWKQQLIAGRSKLAEILKRV